MVYGLLPVCTAQATGAMGVGLPETTSTVTVNSVVPMESMEESIEDSTKIPVHLCVESSGEKITQVIDSVEDSTKVPHVPKMGGDGTFVNHEDSKGLEPSDGLLIGKGLGGVQTTKIPCPTVLEPSGGDGTFDEDEVII